MKKMKDNKLKALLYGIVTFAIFSASALLTTSFFTLELGRGATYESTSRLYYGIISILFLVSTAVAILNWKNKSFNSVADIIVNSIVNVLVPVSLLNTAVLFKSTGAPAWWCIGVSAVVPLLIVLSRKLSKMMIFESLLPLFLSSEDEDSAQENERKVENPSFKEKLPRITVFWRLLISSFLTLFITSTFMLGSLGMFDSHYYRYHHFDLFFNEMDISTQEMEDFSKIREWETLSDKEKLNLLQEVSNREAFRLGIPLEPIVEASEDVYNVSFDSTKNVIEVDLNMLKDGYQAVKAVAQGVFYAYSSSKQELIRYLDGAVENVPAYSCLSDFRDVKTNNKYSLERNAEEYARLSQNEYMRKLILYSYSPKLENY